MENRIKQIQALKGYIGEVELYDEMRYVINETYQTGMRTALIILDADGEVYTNATVNLPGEVLGDGEIFIKNYSENEGVLDALIDAGIVEDTGRRVHSGFAEIPVAKLIERVPYTELTRKEWRKLSMDIADGQVFGSWDIRPEDRESTRPMVFMCLALGGLDITESQLIADPRFPKNELTPVAFYEYYDKAGPRSINGYPCFFSHHVLLGDDIKRVLKLANKFEAAKLAMVNG